MSASKIDKQQSCRYADADPSGLPAQQEKPNPLLGAAWALAVMTFPIVSKLLALDCVFQLIRWLWDGGFVDALRFFVHFALLCGLTYFVGCFAPRPGGKQNACRST